MREAVNAELENPSGWRESQDRPYCITVVMNVLKWKEDKLKAPSPCILNPLIPGLW